ncbi:MAG: type II toxin-antitoxin system VapC family toxin [Chloroflexi bacterium]|nr:type II toxin-antitoxin system VapC family toxin [Chloroflexota bacterium]
MFVLDTNVVSETQRRRPHGAVVAGLASVPNELQYVSAVTLGEMQRGVELTRERDPARAGDIEHWLELMSGTMQVLALDGACFRLSARLMHRRDPRLMFDALIAATALVRGFTVATRHVRDFEPFGVAVFNPFDFRT